MKQNISDSKISSRIGATLIDYTYLYAGTILLMHFHGETLEGGGLRLSGLLGLVPIVAWYILLPLSEGIFGTTIGHWIFDLKIISEKGQTPSIWQSTLRRLCDIVDINCSSGILAIVLINQSEKKQRLGDMIAKTRVISTKEK